MGLLSRWRYSPIIKSMTYEMERLRKEGSQKVIVRDSLRSAGDKKRARILTNELASEARIFLQIQHRISSICADYGIKDPFAI